MNGLGIHREAFNRALGTGLADSFRSVDITDANFSQLGISKGQRFPYIIPGTGTEFVLRAVRARGALLEGSLVKRYVGAAGRIGNLTAASDKAIVVTDDTFVANDLAGGIFFITAGTGANQRQRFIRKNSAAAGASTITVAEREGLYPNTTDEDAADALDTAPDGTSDYSVYCDWEVVASAAATDFVVGVSLGVATSGNWTLILETGICLCLQVGSTDAVTAGGALVPSATAGTAKGPLTAGLTATEAMVAFGEALSAYAGASALRECYLFGKFA